MTAQSGVLFEAVTFKITEYGFFHHNPLLCSIFDSYVLANQHTSQSFSNFLVAQHLSVMLTKKNR